MRRNADGVCMVSIAAVRRAGVFFRVSLFYPLAYFHFFYAKARFREIPQKLSYSSLFFLFCARFNSDVIQIPTMRGKQSTRLR